MVTIPSTGTLPASRGSPGSPNRPTDALPDRSDEIAPPTYTVWTQHRQVMVRYQPGEDPFEILGKLQSQEVPREDE